MENFSEKIFDDLWIQPASGDAGSALGAALVGWHQYRQQERVINSSDSMKGTYLGPEFSNGYITQLSGRKFMLPFKLILISTCLSF